MNLDHFPTVHDTDDYIREWARDRGYSSFSICHIPLAKAIAPDIPDIAEIKWYIRGEPIRRLVDDHCGIRWKE